MSTSIKITGNYAGLQRVIIDRLKGIRNPVDFFIFLEKAKRIVNYYSLHDNCITIDDDLNIEEYLL